MPKTLEICAFLSDSDLSARLGQLAAVQCWTIIHWDTRPTPDVSPGAISRIPDLIFFDRAEHLETLHAADFM